MILRIFLKFLKPFRYEGRFFTLKIKFMWIIITWIENTIVKNILGGTLFPLIFFWRIILDLNSILTWKGWVNRRDTRRLFWEGHYSHYFFFGRIILELNSVLTSKGRVNQVSHRDTQRLPMVSCPQLLLSLTQ